jgi:nitroreductase
MNDTLDLLLTRRSTPPPALAAPGPNAAELDVLLTIAARVPDHGKLAPWRFIVFEGEGRERAADIVEEIARLDRPDATSDQLAVERKRLTQAPLIIAVASKAAPHPKIPVFEQTLSAAACCMNLLVAAQALGYGASWLTNWFAYDRRVLERFGLRPEESMVGFIHIGTKTTQIEDRPRPALAEVVTRF